MSKVLCEEPRRGSGYSRKGKTPRHYDDMPLQEPIREKGKKTKEFGEHLKPLKRYLEKQIGRNWDTVFSEMKKQLRGDNPVMTHAFEHLDGYLAVNVIECPLAESPTGFVHHNEFGRYYDTRRRVYPGELYVCPRSKIIKRAKSRVRTQKNEKKTLYRVMSPVQIALKINDIWYSCDLCSYTKERVWHWRESVEQEDRIQSNKKYPFGHYIEMNKIDGETYRGFPIDSIDITDYIGYHREVSKVLGHPNYIARNKKQMNSQQLRKWNLKNG